MRTFHPRPVRVGWISSLFLVLLLGCGTAANPRSSPGSSVDDLAIRETTDQPTLVSRRDHALRAAGHIGAGTIPSLTSTALAFSPDDRVLALATSQGVELWQTDGWHQTQLLRGHSRPVVSVGWSPDGRILASGSTDGTLCFWQPDGTFLKAIEGFGETFKALAWSPTGSSIAVASDKVYVLTRDGDGIFSVNSNTTSLPPFGGIAWNPDGTMLGIMHPSTDPGDVVSHGDFGSYRTIIDVWTIAERELTRSIKGPDDPLTLLAWSPDGSRIAAASDAGISLWDADETVSFIAHASDMTMAVDLKWAPDSQLLALATIGQIDLYHRDGTPLRSFGEKPHFPTGALAWNTQGTFLAAVVADETVEIWTNAGQRVTTLDRLAFAAIRKVDWSPDGQSLVVAAEHQPALSIWNLDGTLSQRLQPPPNAQCCLVSMQDVAWSPDGAHLVGVPLANTAFLWTATGMFVKLLAHDEPYTTIDAVGWSADGQFLATGSADTSLQVWDAAGNSIQRFSASSSISALAWHPQRSDLAFATATGEIFLWSVPGQTPQAFTHIPMINDLAWSPDGQTLALASDTGTVTLVGMDGTTLATMPDHTYGAEEIAWSFDGSLLASISGDRRVRVWDTRGNLLVTLPDHAYTLSTLAWSPTDMTLAIPGADGQIWIWDTTQELSALAGQHTDRINSLVWRHDGLILASGSDDGTVQLWRRDN
jgi:WD40 repeat protein